jgi:predicted dinucleotide-binding enzyme
LYPPALVGTGEKVKIAVIGTGKMGRGFAAALASRHEVTLGSRDPELAVKVVAVTGAAGVTTYEGAAAGAEVVILAVPWEAMEATLPQLGDLEGTVVIDVSFPYRKAEREAMRGSSTAEEIQKRLPGARVLKGWNHVHARHLTAPEVEGITASVRARARHGVPSGRCRATQGDPRTRATGERHAVHSARPHKGLV